MFSNMFYITHLTGSIYTVTKISLNVKPFRTLQRASCVDIWIKYYDITPLQKDMQ